MVDDQEFCDFMRHCLRRLHALEIQVGALQIALAEQNIPGPAQRMIEVEKELRAHPTSQSMVAAIEALAPQKLLEMLAKYNGPVQ
jgi:hypothetical protein